MARRKQTTLANKNSQEGHQQYFLANDAPWGGFVNIKLDDDQKSEFYSWLEANTVHYPALFDDMLGDGLKASFSFDWENSCYILALQGALVGEDRTQRYVSTSRAGTLSEVTALTVWKHVALTGGDYGNYRPKDSSFMRWG